jgi:hypothetical protein
MKKEGLCFRCEWRARYYEEGHSPRCECGDIDSAVCSCYMYKPVTPVILKPNQNDNRPLIGTVGNMFSGRSHYISLIEPKYKMIMNEDGTYIIYVVPKIPRKKKK